jgi:polyisoprenoid-binding protein YceI
MRSSFTLALLAPALLALPSWSSETVLEFAPPQTQIHWTLGTVLHTVHGTFKLRSGSVRFDPATGRASGELIVDAVSGESGSDSRDNRMRQSILEAPKYPAIVFRPDHVDGSIPAQGKAKLQVHGAFELHGKAHEMTMPVEVDVQPAQVAATAHFDVPYIGWGLKNPSTLFLKVDDHVQVEIQATGKVTTYGTH